jgi:hypothetical protein
MPLKLFVLPIKNLSAPEAEMNAFLRSHRMLAVKKEFVELHTMASARPVRVGTGTLSETFGRDILR